jgi:hypothetical protein
MVGRLGVLTLLLLGCGPEPGAGEALGTPLTDEPTREAPNACGSVIERELASLAVFVAEEMGHWDAANDFEPDPATGELRISAAGKARCVGDCIRTQSILALQSSAGRNERDAAGFKEAVLAGWDLQKRADASEPAQSSARVGPRSRTTKFGAAGSKSREARRCQASAPSRLGTSALCFCRDLAVERPRAARGARA